MSEESVGSSTTAGHVPLNTMKHQFMDPRPRGEAPVTLLPDPEQCRRRYAIVSVDDHLLEPETIFRGRVAPKFADAVPHVVEQADGSQAWVVDGVVKPISMFNAISGRPQDEWSTGAIRFDESRSGVWKPLERVRDMDLAGIWGSLAFPSIPWGFAGQTFSTMKDPDVGYACVQAYNDWLVEEWCGAAPDRLIPSQITWFGDLDRAIAEVRRNAARGVRAISFSENPERLGYPSLHTGHWDPLFAVCQETGTVLNLHVGSSSWTPVPSSDSPPECVATLFEMSSAVATVDWLWSQVPVRFPVLRIALSEGGLGWVPLLLDRLEFMQKYMDTFHSWHDPLLPREVVLRNFRFCSLFDPRAWKLIDDIGVDNVMVETDYPHADSTWPESQDVVRASTRSLSDADVRKVTFANACALYDHPLPPVGWAELGPEPEFAGVAR